MLKEREVFPRGSAIEKSVIGIAVSLPRREPLLLMGIEVAGRAVCHWRRPGGKAERESQMASGPNTPTPTVAMVDNLIDENGAPIELPEGTPIKVAGEHEDSVGAAGPTNWWLYGLVGLAIVIAVLLLLQLFNGAPGTEVQPATPTSAPVVEPLTPAQ